jgi:predicted transcriptional regulator
MAEGASSHAAIAGGSGISERLAVRYLQLMAKKGLIRPFGRSGQSMYTLTSRGDTVLDLCLGIVDEYERVRSAVV